MNWQEPLYEPGVGYRHKSKCKGPEAGVPLAKGPVCPERRSKWENESAERGGRRDRGHQGPRARQLDFGGSSIVSALGCPRRVESRRVTTRGQERTQEYQQRSKSWRKVNRGRSRRGVR